VENGHDKGEPRLRSQIRESLLRLFAAGLSLVKSIRNRRLFRKLFRGNQKLIRSKLYPAGARITILTGPFRGLRYFDESVYGPIIPR
jgi:hypothetical protein